MVYVEVGNAKTAQEQFRLLQHSINRVGLVMSVAEIQQAGEVKELIAGILKQLDDARPSGVDGKHGNLHNSYCGCYIEPDDLAVAEIQVYSNMSGEVERTLWSDNSVTYRHRERRFDGSGIFGQWQNGRGEFG